MRSENGMPELLHVSVHGGRRRNGRIKTKLLLLSHSYEMLIKKHGRMGTKLLLLSHSYEILMKILGGTRTNYSSFSLLWLRGGALLTMSC